MTKKLSNVFTFPKKMNVKTEILSGATVALALVPEALAFAMIAGFSPLTGLYTAFVIGMITSILGGRPGMISGATGAVSVIFSGLILALRTKMPDITIDGIMPYVFATVILAGVLQIIAGLLKLGKFIRLVPGPVMSGFVNGLAIVIFMAQFPTVVRGSVDLQSTLTMLGLIALTMSIIWILPKFTKAIPASLVAIIVVSSVVIGLGIDTLTVADTLRPGESINGTFPPFTFPMIPFTWDTLLLILPYSAIIAGVGLIESLLVLNLIDEMIDSRGSGNKECIAQGTANIASGFLSGMGGCVMLGQSLINISGGARHRLSGMVASSLLLVFILFGSSVIEQLPMAALVGLMFMVSIRTFEWSSLKIFKKMPMTDVIVMVFVTLVTAITRNIAIAVLAGIVVAALSFSWENAMRIRARKFVDDDGVKHYEIFGPLFFGSTKVFTDKFDIHDDPEKVVINFKDSRITDMSAISCVHNLTERYKKAGKIVHLKYLSEDCKILLQNASAIIDVNIMEDPSYKVVTNNTKPLYR